jgi:hypothetical protein
MKALGRRHGLSQHDTCELRDQLGKRFNMSGRNLDRYLRVLSTPIEVQHAVDADKLPITLAEKVAGLKKHQQEKIAAEISAGKDPRQVVRQVVASGTKRHKSVDAALMTFLRNLQSAMKDMADRTFTGSMDEDCLNLLDQGKAFIAGIRATALENDKRQREEGWTEEQQIEQIAELAAALRK